MRKSKIQKLLMLALTVTMVAGSTLTAGATTTSSDAACAAAADAAVVAATTAVIPSTSDVVVNGATVTTTVKGAYLAKTVNGFAVTEAAAEISAAYALADGRTPYILVMDTDKVKSHLAMDSLNAAAAALGATMGPVINIDLGYRYQNMFYTLPMDGAKVAMTVGIPADFAQADATYAVVVVRAGGAIEILEDLDADPATVSFETSAGLGCYAVVRY